MACPIWYAVLETDILHKSIQIDIHTVYCEPKSREEPVGDIYWIQVMGVKGRRRVFFYITECPSQLTRTSTNSGALEITARHNSQ